MVALPAVVDGVPLGSDGEPLPEGHEWDEVERCPVGRDPRSMTTEQLNALGHVKRPLLDAIRQNCLACCCGSQAEVRRCTMLDCPFWPYRMHTNPFVTRTLSDRQKAEAKARLATASAKRRGVADLPEG